MFVRDLVGDLVILGGWSKSGSPEGSLLVLA